MITIELSYEQAMRLHTVLSDATSARLFGYPQKLADVRDNLKKKLEQAGFEEIPEGWNGPDRKAKD